MKIKEAQIEKSEANLVRVNGHWFRYHKIGPCENPNWVCYQALELVPSKEANAKENGYNVIMNDDVKAFVMFSEDLWVVMQDRKRGRVMKNKDTVRKMCAVIRAERRELATLKLKHKEAVAAKDASGRMKVQHAINDVNANISAYRRALKMVLAA